MDQEQLNREVEATMNSLAGMPKPEPDAFFYHRLKERMDGMDMQAPPVLWLSPRLKWAAAASLAALLTVNTFAVISTLNANQTAETTTENKNYIQTLSEEYTLDQSVYLY